MISSQCKSGVAPNLLLFYNQGTLVGFWNHSEGVETKDVLLGLPQIAQVSRNQLFLGLGQVVSSNQW